MAKYQRWFCIVFIYFIVYSLIWLIWIGHPIWQGLISHSFQSAKDLINSALRIGHVKVFPKMPIILIIELLYIMLPVFVYKTKRGSLRKLHPEIFLS